MTEDTTGIFHEGSISGCSSKRIAPIANIIVNKRKRVPKKLAMFSRARIPQKQAKKTEITDSILNQSLHQ